MPAVLCLAAFHPRSSSFSGPPHDAGGAKGGASARPGARRAAGGAPVAQYQGLWAGPAACRGCDSVGPDTGSALQPG
eukprot:scaffold5303_cov392-Prasinococcus_capsulatus_cf.AAC.2